MVAWIPTGTNLADAFTKRLPKITGVSYLEIGIIEQIDH